MEEVLPASAGMSPDLPRHFDRRLSAPRVSGDEPPSYTVRGTIPPCSPRQRG